MATVIVTSPHSLCYHNIKERHCDLASYIAATRLLLQLDQNGTMEYFPATLPRFQVDLNRFSSRNTQYREKISQALKHAKLLVDIHSFPKGYFEGIKVAILDNKPGTWYGELLYRLLEQNGISVGYFYGSLINDIVNESRNRGIPAILIEYGEYLNLGEIDRINQIVILWIEYISNLK